MNKEQIEAQIKAAAWQAAGQLGWREALAMLHRVAAEIENLQWAK